MEDKEVLLFEVVFDAPKVQERAELLGHVIAQLRKEKQETDKEFKKGVIGADEYAKSMQAIDTQLVKAQADYKAVSKEIADYDKIQKAAAGSVEQMKAKLDALIPSYQSMSKEQRENTVSGKALQAQIRELAAEQKAIQDSYGATARTAGEYGTSLVELERQISDLSEEYDNLSESQRQQKDVGGVLLKRIDDLKDAHEREQKVIDNSRKGVKEYIKDINVLGFNVGATIESFKSGASGIATFAKGITTLRGGLTALIAIPIVAAFAFLITILTKTQAGLDFVERTTASLKAVFNSFINSSAAIGQSLVKLFTDPKAAIVELKNEILGLFGAATAAATAANKVTASNQQIRESERAIGVEREKNLAQIERLKLIAEDTSKSQGVRERAAKEAYALEAKSLKDLTDLQRQKIANAQTEFDLSTKTAEDRDKLAEAQKEYFKIEQDSLGKQTELNNSLNTIRQEGIQKAKEAAQLAAAERVAEGERALIRAKRLGIDTLAIEEELIRRKGAAEKVGIEKGAQQRKLVDARVNAEILENKVRHLAELEKLSFDKTEDGLNTELLLIQANDKRQLELEIELINQRQDRQKAEAVNAAELDIKLQVGLKKRLLAIDAKASVDRETAQKTYNQQQINRTAELAQLTIQTENDLSADLLNERRNRAVSAINIEEQRQLDLLKLEKISGDERDTREKAIQARAAALRKEQYQLIKADRRADRQAEIETQIAQTYGDNKKALDLQKRLLAVQMEEELANTELGEKQKAAVRAKYRRTEQDLQRDYNKRQLDMILDSISQSVGALGKVFDAQAQVNADLLDKQQSAALKSAGLSAEAREKIEEKFTRKKEELDRQAAEKRRKIATIENIIAGARGIADAIVKNVGNPFMQALQIALVIGTVASQQAVIASQKFARGGEIPEPDQKLGRGGMVNGPSHAEGGVKYQIGRQQVELEGGEGVINKWAMRIPEVRRKASELNQMAGNGVAFGPQSRIRIQHPKYIGPPRFDLGGITPSGSGNQSIPAIDYDAMTNAFIRAVGQLPSPIVRVGDVRDGVARQVRVEQNAEIA